MSQKVKGMIHSRSVEGPQYFDIVAVNRTGAQTEFIAEVVSGGGIRNWCLAIRNPFNGLYYADDLYALLPDSPEEIDGIDNWDWV